MRRKGSWWCKRGLCKTCQLAYGGVAAEDCECDCHKGGDEDE